MVRPLPPNPELAIALVLAAGIFLFYMIDLAGKIIY